MTERDAMGPALLDIRLTAGYGKQTVLRDLELQVQPGERIGLLGTSGAGKSTLLLALLGLLPRKRGWASGEVTLSGKNLLSLPEREARELRGSRIALIPQSPSAALNPALSLAQHFRHAWRAHCRGQDAALTSRLEELLQRVQLPSDAAFLDRKANEISVGQAQRAVIALALLHRPSVLIADEPTSALDPPTAVQVLALLKDAVEAENAALLFVSHDLLSVVRVCTDVAYMETGRIVERLPLAALPNATQPGFRALLQALPCPITSLLSPERKPHEQNDKY